MPPSPPPSHPESRTFRVYLTNWASQTFDFSERTTSLSAFGWCCFVSSSFLVVLFFSSSSCSVEGQSSTWRRKTNKEASPQPLLLLWRGDACSPTLCCFTPRSLPSLSSFGWSFLFLRGSCCRSLFLFLPSLGPASASLQGEGQPGTRNSNPKMERQPRPQQGSFTPSSGVLGLRLWTFFTA